MDILVNHVGYDASDAGNARVRALIQAVGDEELPASAVLRDIRGRRMAEVPAVGDSIVAGWSGRRFATIEFEVPEGGPYTLTAGTGELEAVSAPFRVGRDIVARSILSDLLFGIRSYRCDGAVDQADRAVPFYGGRTGSADVHGGWYDASGDTSKYLSHLSYSGFMNPQQTPLVVWVLMDALDRLEASRFPMGERLRLRFREEALWGVDFLLRMQDSEGYFYTTVFDGWSRNLDARRICSYRGKEGTMNEDYRAAYRQGGGMAVAALARASRMSGVDAEKRSLFHDAAFRGWRHLEERNTDYLENGAENIIDDACALMAAAELCFAGAGEAREAAEARAASLCGRWSDAEGFFRADESGSWSWFHASDEALPVVALMRDLETGSIGGDLGERVSAVVRSALDAELTRSSAVSNPFLHPRRLVRVPGRTDEIRFFYPHENPSGYWWQGENARLASWAAAFRRWDAGNGPRAHRPEDRIFADAQISWILGRNPFDACMLQGHGRNNPAYDWDHFNVPGGVANGITSGFADEDDIAFMPSEAMASGDHSWRWAEQWIPHAAWLLEAAAWSVPSQ